MIGCWVHVQFKLKIIRCLGGSHFVPRITQLRKQSHPSNIRRVHRVQLAANSYLQAPAVLQCYLVQKGATALKGMMNLAQFVRRNFTSEQLSGYVVDDCGGDATRILQTILQNG
jgi:hypothetical protein